ncbi:UNVERIFIED_CONTAM: glycosyltransferase family 39 protein [Kocuria sp. CPCC 205316]|uniref:hypothetical protein n=1 Tax=Kocuria TaxID=57493 RepID=UPI0036DF3E3D
MTSSTLLGDGWGSATYSTIAGDKDVVVPASEAATKCATGHPAADTAVISENNGLLSVSAALVGVLSYACTLLMVNSLGSADYSDFAAAQMLLGIAGTIAAALVPLPLSHAVATNPIGSQARREGLAFALLVSVIVGTAAAVIAGTLTAAFASLPMALAVGFAALLFFVVSASQGWLQGELRFKWYAVVAVAEVALRLVFSLMVVAFAWGSTGAVLGFALGALVLLVVPLSFYRDLRLLPAIVKQRWRWLETGDIAIVLCVVSALVGFDVVVIPFLDDGSDAAAGFQALATIAKGPVYIAAGTALVAFPLLRSATADTDSIVAHALRAFGGLALPAAAVIATVPPTLMALVLPQRYHSALDMLPWLAAAGLGYAAISVLATILLGLRCYRRCQLGLVATALLILAGIFVGWHLGSVTGLAIGSAIGSLLAAAVLIAISLPRLPSSMIRMTLKAVIAVAALAALFTLAASVPVLWLLVAAMTGLLVLTLQRWERGNVLPTLGDLVTRREVLQNLRHSSAAIAIAGFVISTSAAIGIRAVGLGRSFELQGDELLYAELGRSVSFGQLPNLELQTLPDGPFFLHPPGFFLIEGIAIKTLGLSGNTFDLVYDLRWLNAIIGALSVGLGFLLIRKLTNTSVASVSAVVLAFEPFVLRNHSRVYIETLGTAMVLVGLLIIVSLMLRQSDRIFPLGTVCGGLVLGYGVLTKDVFVLFTVAPIILAVMWKQTLRPLQAIILLMSSAAPYVFYLVVLAANNVLFDWLLQKTNGLRRMLGFEQSTGFNAEGAPSLVGRMIDQITSFGTSYILLGLGPITALYVCRSARPERRLIGLAGVVMGFFGLYSAAFGTFEEQYGYPVMIAGILSMSVFALEVCERNKNFIKMVTVAGTLFAVVVVLFGLRAETTSDDGYARFRQWMPSNLPANASVSVTNVTAELAFADDSRFGAWPSPELMDQNNVDYILTHSLLTLQGYGYASPEMLEWLTYTATEVVTFEGPTNGATTLWRVDENELREAADASIAPPTENFYLERAG